MVLAKATTPSAVSSFAAPAAASSKASFGVELRPINVREVGGIERAIPTFARFPNGGLIVTAGSGSSVHGDLIITLAARHRLPAVYGDLHLVTGGGLISYGADDIEQHWQAAGYVDRILRGEKPADLPVQAPVKFDLVVNIKAARALGLTLPESFLLRADEVIE